MSTRGPAAFLWDARTAIEEILETVRGHSLETYAANRNLRKIVERDLITLGEALSQFRRLDPMTAARLPSLSSAVAFRNIVVHSYTQLRIEVVWRTVHDDLPALAAELDALLRGYEES